MRARAFIATFGLVGALLFSSIVSAADKLPPTEEIVRLFHDVVFKTESGFGSDGKPVVKWVSPINIYVQQFPGAQFLTQLERPLHNSPTLRQDLLYLWHEKTF